MIICLPDKIHPKFIDYQNLIYLDNGYFSSILHLLRLPSDLTCFGCSNNDNLENFLERLAEKAKNFSLKLFHFVHKVTVQKIEKFL